MHFDFEDQDDEVGGTEDQDTDGDYKVNKTSQKKFIPYKPKSKAAMVIASVVKGCAVNAVAVTFERLR